MSSRDDAAALDILTSARRAIEFRGQLDRPDFEADGKTFAAVLLQLLIIGEATKRLSAGFRDEHSEVPWAGMAAMRDRLIHSYDAVDPVLVWETVSSKLPEVVLLLEAIVPRDDKDPSVDG